jgi:transposase-like protein
VIETETLLVNYPRCGASPMAASLPKSNAVQALIRFRCPTCRYEESELLRHAGIVRRFSEQRPRAGG